jgi:hypothetical protein
MCKGLVRYFGSRRWFCSTLVRVLGTARDCWLGVGDSVVGVVCASLKRL